ncbi:glucose-methanol-choline oxidoreductase [Paenibacillus curdlanolyticus YK9]|uniref:Glucose-methanol-choline oxidoreductase n=1 Tax=Paenibacillus curdlanolyticus YK9 TaxID=717606 RepID=E0ID09_9BACL|nr:GMC oxidoreductase [Paenibacillus curdlanolyticus]EFM09464.1 glucose-methanol-choline oxidoreductase [Paenibacillus curdlanolyticus YK9]
MTVSAGNAIGISTPSWLPTTTLDQMSRNEYDVLVVGTGAGGGAVIWRLCEHWRSTGKKVGVIEAGDLILPTNLRNVETMNPERVDALAYGSGGIVIPVPGTKFREIIAVGGRTLVWNAISPRMRVKRESWHVPLQEMDQYYDIAEQALQVSGAYVEGSPINRILLNRLWSEGYHYARKMPTATDMVPTKYGEMHSNVYFSSIKFLAGAVNRRPIDLAVLSRAVGVLASNGKVEGIEAATPDLRTYRIKAKKVVLCTSTIETPRLLLYSGIPGPAIGHYLTTHSVVWGAFPFNRTSYPYVTGTAGILLPEQEGRPFQIQVEGPSRSLFYHDPFIPFQSVERIKVAGVGTVQPRYDNRVSLNPCNRDRYGVPEVDVQMTYSPHDYAVSALAEQSVLRIASLLGFQSTPLTRDVPLQGDHESCTCRMGNDPMTSATNQFGQIHGIAGLFIADNSVIPKLEAASPTLTTIALALRTADYIARTS